MCGIAGILSSMNRARPDRAELHSMVAVLGHRGPDGSGFHLDGPVGLGHARLSIIDMESGDQPIHNEDRTVWVVLNGEIFNYVELRDSLMSEGHGFYTQSDTEVIVHLYERHGDRFVDFLNGQFAIALWDAARKRLILARDRTGMRPLFYAQSGDRLYFASEVKALLLNPEIPRRLDPVALAQTFTFWAPLESQSAFEGIHSLPPGHTLTAEAGRTRLCRYWDWTFPDETPGRARTPDDAAEELRAILIDAVRLQLRADVPVGAYLSGGLDSSIITTVIRNCTQTPLRTFSVTFEDAEFDEAPYQRALSQRLGTSHTEVMCRRSDIAEMFPRLVWHVETPILRTAPAPLMMLSGLVRASGYKVVLTGEGADEVFAGYDIFKEAKIRRFWARQPASSIRPRLFERLYPYLRHSPSAGGAFTRSFFGQGMEGAGEPCFGHRPRWTTTQRILRYLAPDMRSRIGAYDPVAAFERTLPSSIGRWAPLARDQYVEAHTLLSGYLLSAQGDRVAMANSIEARYPFLDHRLIEFASTLPPGFKLRGLAEKAILKDAFRDMVPEAIRRRTKQPYRAPDSASFFSDGKPCDYVADLFSEARIREAGYFAPRAVAQLFEKCRKGNAIGFADNMAFVGVLSTMLLHESLVRTLPTPDSAPARTAETLAH